MPEITLLLHNIRSTHNVGSIFRTADGFGVTKIICSGYTPYPKLTRDTRLPHVSEKITSQIRKVALGAEASVPFEHVNDIEAWLDGNDLPLVALEQATDSINIAEFSPPLNFVLLLGEEVHGIDKALLARCAPIIEIPMQGKKESFNVSVAAGIALYQLTSA